MHKRPGRTISLRATSSRTVEVAGEARRQPRRCRQAPESTRRAVQARRPEQHPAPKAGCAPLGGAGKGRILSGFRRPSAGPPDGGAKPPAPGHSGKAVSRVAPSRGRSYPRGQHGREGMSAAESGLLKTARLSGSNQSSRIATPSIAGGLRVPRFLSIAIQASFSFRRCRSVQIDE